jgi:peptidoglycan/LPS O-acetylase OafA/YrhL
MGAGSLGDSGVARAISGGVRPGLAPPQPTPSARLRVADAVADATATDRVPARAEGRIDTLDAARLVAILAVVFLHSTETPALKRFDLVGTFAVPFYLFASLYFQARSLRRTAPSRNIAEYVVSRLKRLYLPFLAWTVIYLVARNAKHLFVSNAPPVAFEWHHLWTGSAHHLWFLPFLIIASLLSAFAARFSNTRPTLRRAIIAACALLGGILAVAPRPAWLNHIAGQEGYFFYQCWRALPSAFLGLALAWILSTADDDDSLITPIVGLAGALLTIGTVTDQLINGYSRLERTLSGLGWMLAALATWRGPWVNWMARGGRNAYGIYLTHVLFIEGVQAVAHRAGFGSSVGLDAVTIAAGFGGGLLLTNLLSRSRRTAWLNG